jgi:hypothetical protein
LKGSWDTGEPLRKIGRAFEQKKYIKSQRDWMGQKKVGVKALESCTAPLHVFVHLVFLGDGDAS